MELKVYGPGCTKCKITVTLLTKVAEKYNLDVKVTKVDDMMEIIEAGLMSTPAVMLNNQMHFIGRVPSEKEVLDLIESNK